MKQAKRKRGVKNGTEQEKMKISSLSTDNEQKASEVEKVRKENENRYCGEKSRQ